MERPYLVSLLRRRRYAVLSAFAAFTISGFAALQSAYAWEEYPTVLKEYGAPNPTCLVCHINALGGGLHNSFGEVIKAGNTLGRLPKLRTLLEMLKATNHDTDGDGIPDLTEIAAGTEPSVANGGTASTSTPAPAVTPSTVVPATPSPIAEPVDDVEYGCVGSVAGRRAHSRGVELLAALFVAALLWRTRSRA